MWSKNKANKIKGEKERFSTVETTPRAEPERVGKLGANEEVSVGKREEGDGQDKDRPSKPCQRTRGQCQPLTSRDPLFGAGKRLNQ